MKPWTIPAIVAAIVALGVVVVVQYQAIARQEATLRELEGVRDELGDVTSEVSRLRARIDRETRDRRQAVANPPGGAATTDASTGAALDAAAMGAEELSSGEITAALTQDDAAIDVLAERLARRIDENPPTDADGQPLTITPEVAREMVRGIQEEERAARTAKRLQRTEEMIQRQVDEYRVAVNLDAAQAAALQRILVASSTAGHEIRERARDGDIARDEARDEWRQLRDQVNQQILDELGQEKGQELLDYRDQDDDRSRRRGRGGR